MREVRCEIKVWLQVVFDYAAAAKTVMLESSKSRVVGRQWFICGVPILFSFCLEVI
jgi:hypothetical protein